MVGLIPGIKGRIYDLKYKRHQKRLTPDIWLEDLYALDDTLSVVISHYLKDFREFNPATPGIFFRKYGDDCGAQWDAVIDKMILAFDTHHRLQSSFEDPTPEEKSAIKEGLQAFAEYFEYLNY